jgi:c-di-GMP-binding flagellar brake protein YcgR
VCLGVNGRTPEVNRRRWPRLPLAIPVFVRSRTAAEREVLEFATALNVSAGGMLVAVRHSLASATQVSLEIPSAPLTASAGLPSVVRSLRAKVMRTQAEQGYNLLGLEFSHPLVASPDSPKSRRKLASFV